MQSEQGRVLSNDLQKIILVDESDRQVGIDNKLHAHQNGAKLHRAISVFIFNKRGETLLQKRAMTKYHSAGKWANACCSHPMPKESVADAAHRRLREEMGFDCEMHEAFAFTYKADVGNGLTEHEYDHVFFGEYDEEVKADKDEVMDYRWVSMKSLREEIERKPDAFAPWLRICIDRVASLTNRL